MSSEFGYENDLLRLAIISYITSNPNSTLENILTEILDTVKTTIIDANKQVVQINTVKQSSDTNCN